MVGGHLDHHGAGHTRAGQLAGVPNGSVGLPSPVDPDRVPAQLGMLNLTSMALGINLAGIERPSLELLPSSDRMAAQSQHSRS